MVKIVRYYPPGVPAWARLPQWEERTTPPCKDARDVDMEGIELTLEKKLVLPKTVRLKRTRTDVGSACGVVAPRREALNLT